MLLDELPPELLPNVYKYLPAREVWVNLRLVCRSLNRTIKRPSYWQKRAAQHCGLVLPERLRHLNNSITTNELEEEQDGDVSYKQDKPILSSTNEEKNFQQLSQLMPIFRCIATEHSAQHWSDSAYGLNRHNVKTEAHLGIIDTVRVFRVGSNEKLFCLTGSRDRAIKLWNLETAMQNKTSKNTWNCTTVDQAHTGWIWSISPAADGSFFYSAGWDSLVRKWELAEAEIKQTFQIQTSEAALCCIADGPHLLYVSTYHRGPILYDMRSGTEPLAILNYHVNKSVFQMVTEAGSDQLFSIGDDRRLVAIDKRQYNQVLNDYATDVTIWNMDYSERQLCLSLSNGKLLFLDPDNLQVENVFLTSKESENIFMGRQIVRLTHGATFCASSDSRLRVITPGLRPRVVAITEPMGYSITRFDVLAGHVVAALDTSALCYWPKEWVD